jgi:dinuclear metal center YbgI/SA1388 family protein
VDSVRTAIDAGTFKVPAGAPEVAALAEVVAYLDVVLATADTPDYGGAVNGLQLENPGTVTRVAAAVDFSTRTVDQCVRSRCDLLLVHHGMFWGGVQPLRGPVYTRLRGLIEHGVAVYASHLPLDRHPELGNNALLARTLGLVPTGDFAPYKTISVGVRGESDLPTAQLVAALQRLAAEHRGQLRTAGRLDGGGRRTRRWAICTGAGASSDTLREARDAGIDTLIVGEGPHHTFVEANDADDLVVLYAGHYATETLGVRALAERLQERFGLPWEFLDVPTGS